jgi:hypothetical protein
MNFITRKYISRRTVLQGAGAVIALPLLDAMIPASTALAQTAAKPTVKLGFLYFPHGAIMEQWTPEKQGADFELSPILEPLKPFQKQLTIVSGLGNRPGESQAVHAIVPATWLSCVHPKQGQDPNMAATADQIAAKAIGQDTPLPSIEIATEGMGGGGSCDRDYGCNYSGTISYRTPTTPLPMEYNPRNLFQRLFGRGDTPQERKELVAEYSSVLDMVSDDAKSLERKLGARDRAMLSDYMDTVRELERRVQKTQTHDLSKLKLPEVPVGIPENVDTELNLMLDMAALAYQGGLTRIINYMFAAEVSGRTYNLIGVPDAFHAVSHHGNDPAKKAKLVKIQNYHTKVLAKWLTRLKEMPDGDGSMLDHSIILYGSNMSNSDRHNQFPLPTTLIGGGCGKLKGGQHLVYPDHTPLANVLLTMLDRAGVPIEKLGDSNGKMAEI